MLMAMHPPGFPAAIPPLVGATLRLRELTEDDIPSWFERSTDRESADLAGDTVPSSSPGSRPAPSSARWSCSATTL